MSGTETVKKDFLPRLDGAPLDFLKIIAALLMVNDHINAILLHESQFGMLLMGRGTFPIFCYAIAVGILRSDEKHHLRYVRNLVILAVLITPIYYFSMPTDTVNVIFTLAMGAAFAAVVHKMKPWQIYACYIAAVVSNVLMPMVPIEFGIVGVMIPSAFVMIWRGQRNFYPWLLLLLATTNIQGGVETLMGGPLVATTVVSVLMGGATICVPWEALELARQVKPSGKRMVPKYALHIFYPAHMLIIKLFGLVF